LFATKLLTKIIFFMNSIMDAKYWDEKYRGRQMGWDIGYASPPIVQYADQLTDKAMRILIPGAGNAYEAEYLWKNGFRNVHVLDWSVRALEGLKERVADFPEEHLIRDDFFHHTGQYDRIFEQTFFCALPPALRPQYVEHMAELLADEGKLVGVLFNIPLFEDHPPFGGNQEEYLALFERHLEVLKMEPCYNSIPERAGNEVFFMAKKA